MNLDDADITTWFQLKKKNVWVLIFPTPSPSNPPLLIKDSHSKAHICLFFIQLWVLKTLHGAFGWSTSSNSSGPRAVPPEPRFPVEAITKSNVETLFMQPDERF